MSSSTLPAVPDAFRRTALALPISVPFFPVQKAAPPAPGAPSCRRCDRAEFFDDVSCRSRFDADGETEEASAE